MNSWIVLLCICGALPLIQSTPYVSHPEDSTEESVEVPLKISARRSKRSILDHKENHEMTFSAYGKNFSLYFEQYDHVLMGSKTPIFTATRNRYPSNSFDEILYTEIPNAMSKLQLKAFVDQENGAYAVQYDPKRMMGFLNIDNEYSYKFIIPNVRATLPSITVNRKPARDETNSKPEKQWLKYKPMPRGIPVPEVIYPEVAVVLDNFIYEENGKSWEEVVKYMFAYWIGVDLRYRTFESPRIRINVAGIVIATDISGVPYMDRSNLSITINNAKRNFVPPKALADADAFAFIVRDPKVELMNLDQTMSKLAGVAHFTGLCTESPFLVSYDGSDYSGVQTTAHELGHLFGAKDEEIGETPCARRNSIYLMGYADQDDDANNQVGLYFSECSKSLIYAHIRTELTQCTYNKPDVGNVVPKVLPYISMDDQCKREFGEDYVVHDIGSCGNLKCMHKEVLQILNAFTPDHPFYSSPQAANLTKPVSTAFPPVEGSICDAMKTKMCLNGKCLPIPEGYSISDVITLPSATEEPISIPSTTEAKDWNSNVDSTSTAAPTTTQSTTTTVMPTTGVPSTTSTKPTITTPRPTTTTSTQRTTTASTLDVTTPKKVSEPSHEDTLLPVDQCIQRNGISVAYQKNNCSHPSIYCYMPFANNSTEIRGESTGAICGSNNKICLSNGQCGLQITNKRSPIGYMQFSITGSEKNALYAPLYPQFGMFDNSIIRFPLSYEEVVYECFSDRYCDLKLNGIDSYLIDYYTKKTNL